MTKGAVAALANATCHTRLEIDREKPPEAPPRRPLHWALEFPEVFARERGGFDLVTGNPPFLGGQRITGRLGTNYRAFLVRFKATARSGSADLVAYFFLLGSIIARHFAFIATNTIGQGDTREVALDTLLANSWSIVRAEKSRKWPSAAAIQVAEVWLHHGQTAQPAILAGQLVAGISALLVPMSRASGNPHRLKANVGMAFQGTNLLGVGFTVTLDRARQLIESDVRNLDVLSPYISAADLCERFDVSPARWVINFHDWKRDRAARYEECFAQVSNLVRPERASNKTKQRREIWWQFTRRSPELYAALSGLKAVIAMPLHSKFLMPMRLPNGYVYSHGLSVFASDADMLYGIISSEIHRAWSRARGSTLETRARYTPTDCFETFALPTGDASAIGDIMRVLHEYRATLMVASASGVTATYNRVHRRTTTETEVVVLRELHRKLDLAVLAEYGWEDVDLDHDFRDTDEGLRFTVSDEARVEILDRLLELNHERYAAEIANGVWEVPRPLKNGRRRDKAEEHVPTLLELS